MAKPVSRILVINDEHLVLREFVKGLNAAARSLDNPLGIAEYLASLLRSQKRMEIHGVVHEGYQPCVRVLKAAEEKGLRPIR